MIFNQIERYGQHEQVLFFNDPSVNLKGIIALHNTALGGAVGGCRMWPYSSEKEALVDALRLSKGMTYKAAVAGLDQGGGKSVIIYDSKNKTPDIFRSFGRFVHCLNGKYIAAEDVGTSVEDMKYIRESTPFVTGLPEQLGGTGDPSPFTAQSTLMGIKAAVAYKLKKKSLSGLKVAIQGMGHVGTFLAEYLLKEGCELVICDIFEQKAQNFKKNYPEVRVVSAEKIYKEDCDVFSPCALGSTINFKTLELLKCSIIAGAANNQLGSTTQGEVDILGTAEGVLNKIEKTIRQKNILYAPDFVINAGGVISVAMDKEGFYSDEKIQKKIKNIYTVLETIFFTSDKEGKNPTNVAIEMANARINKKSNPTAPQKVSV